MFELLLGLAVVGALYWWQRHDSVKRELDYQKWCEDYDRAVYPDTKVKDLPPR